MMVLRLLTAAVALTIYPSSAPLEEASFAHFSRSNQQALSKYVALAPTPSGAIGWAAMPRFR
jgi:hypothetical protein